jgi:hypothetical protein
LGYKVDFQAIERSRNRSRDHACYAASYKIA